jgi:transposase
MKQSILKQCVGIDISKDDFSVCFCVLTSELTLRIKGSRSFKNDATGFSKFHDWFTSKQEIDYPLFLTMEATGVYYESLAYYLDGLDLFVQVVLPNQAKKFGQSLGVKSKTDKIDARILAQMGLERPLPRWKPLSAHFRELKGLTRERDAIITERTVAKNQLHAYCYQGIPAENSIERCHAHIEFLNQQIQSIEKEIKDIVGKDAPLKQRMEYVLSIKGVGYWSAITVISETNGFASIQSIKQLVSYAGLDVRLSESGKWKGKSKISKRGNKHIRKSLYFPALSKIAHDPATNRYYERIKSNKGVSMIAAVAVQRKLLGLMYTLWNKQQMFSPQAA